MSKEKIRVSVVFEYEPNLDDYPNCKTVADAARFDELENPFTECPEAYEDDIVKVTYEAISD